MPYLTPISIPQDTVCFLIQVPNDRNLKSAFIGALLDLTFVYNWEQSDGGLTPQQTVDFTIGWYQDIMESLCMSICSDIVAGCLTDPDFNIDIFEALLPLGAGGDGGGANNPLPTIDDLDISGLSPGCTDADKYGVCYSVVNQLNILGRDLLQLIEVASNAVEAGEKLINAIPIFGGLISAVVGTIDWIQEYADEAYNASFTSTTHEGVACEIYCEMDGCSLTIADIRTALRTILANQNPPSFDGAFPDFINWVTPLIVSLTPIQVVAIVQLFVVEVLVRGSKFLGSSFRTLEIAGALSSALAPPAGCGCTPVQCWLFTLSGGNPMGIDNGDGTFSSVDTGLSNPHRIQIEWEEFSANEWTFGNIVSGAIGNARVWDSGDYSGSLVLNAQYVNAISQSPVSGGAMALISTTPFTVNLSMTGGDEC